MTAPPSVALTWYACDLQSGRIAEELPLSLSGALSRKLSVSTSAQWDLAVAGAPPEWEAATDPGRTMLVPVDTLTGQPLGAWIILTRTGGTDQTVQLGGATPEAYLDRRYTSTYTAVQTDQAQVMAGLADAVLSQGGKPPMVLDAPDTGVLMDYAVQDGDDRTVLSAWQEIAGMDGGPEFTVDVEWADAAESMFQLVLRVRPTIGVQNATPEAVFDLPGCISTYSLSESYEAGRGATVIVAWGEGEGESRLRSDVYTADDLISAGWCRYIHRYTPAAGLDDVAQLNAHAAAALAQMRTGSRAWTVEAVASRAPRLGRDWALGDSLRVQIASSPRHPSGAEVVARVYAWELDSAADRVRPILLEDD